MNKIDILEKIKSLIMTTVQGIDRVYLNYISTPKGKEWLHFYENLTSNILIEIRKIIDYADLASLGVLFQYFLDLNQIISSIDTENTNELKNVENLQIANNCLDHIERWPSQATLDEQAELDVYAIINIYNSLFNFLHPFNLNKININNVNTIKSKRILKDISFEIIQLKNLSTKNDFYRNAVYNHHNNLNKLLNQEREEEINQKTIDLENQVIRVTEKLEYAKNKASISIFKDMSDNMSTYIFLLNMGIFLSLSLIAVTLFTRLHSNNVSHDVYHLIYFLSFIISLSSITAFLIKEKNRLIRLNDIYTTNYLELSALPTYLADIEETKRDELRIALAHKYFRGAEQSNGPSDASMIDELSARVEQTLKLVKEMKETINK